MKHPTFCTEPLFAGDIVDVHGLDGQTWHAPQCVELPADEAQDVRERFSPLASDPADGAIYDESENRAQKPAYRFVGEVPTPLVYLRDKQRWVAWDFRQKGGKWTKPPFDPRTGRHASVSNPATWATFNAALAGMERFDLAGVGLVLTDDDDITGIDLDHCINDSGSFSALAAEIISYGETYAEISPSGEGIRIFSLGKVGKALKDDTSGVEVYGTGRYLTVTGRQIEGTPSEIRQAPRTLARLATVVDRLRGASRPNGNGKAHASADFFPNVNALALARLGDWVPLLHPTACKSPNGAWRITSHDLGRGLEEDLSYHTDGIRDHGEEHGLTPIDAVQRYGDADDPKAAAIWLCRKLGIEPASLGWKKKEHDENLPPRDEKRSGVRGKPTQAELLITIATREDVKLFHTPDRTPYADIMIDGHRETWPLKSRGFSLWWRRAYFTDTKSAPNSDAISQAMGIIEAMALFNGPTLDVHLRIAAVGNDRVYLDLCDKNWRVVEIGPYGWRAIDSDECPIRFRRTAGMLPLPPPVRGGKIDELRRHINLGGDAKIIEDNASRREDAFVLIVSFLLAILRGRGPYPILALSGEQGTGKTLLLDLLRRLVDPNVAPLRTLPRDVRDLYISAINGHILAFDNLSSISGEISDALCRLSTGGGFSTRALYTDGDEVLFDGQRPIALNGINDVASRSDLADRVLAAKLETIPSDKRQLERQLREAFDAARPRILGALLDAVAQGLERFPNTRLNQLPRMADFAHWIRACEGEALWPVGTHMSVYNRNRSEAAEIVIESDPVATALQRHMEHRPDITTTASELFVELSKLAPEHVHRERGQWPGSAQVLSGKLTRLAPALRHAGLEITASRQGHTGKRLIHVRHKVTHVR